MSSIGSSFSNDTIIALATPEGTSALAVIRVSGPDAITGVNALFSKDLSKAEANTLHYGILKHQGEILDEVVLSIFISPSSYTGEDIVEISCHGSPFVAKSIIQAFVQEGIRAAEPGEFTKRAFLNGKMDLSQAEAVADMIHAHSEVSRTAAASQLKGGITEEIKVLRDQLLNLSALLELELDFSEEDVEFADRTQLIDLANKVEQRVGELLESFAFGNAVKDGVPVVIAGKPNVGKSTLLNALLKEERAIVSDQAGTTRDFIEDELHIKGIRFRFSDTAGLRETQDEIEKIGVEKAREKIDKSRIILYLFDASNKQEINSLKSELSEFKDFDNILLIGNKVDKPGNNPGISASDYGVDYLHFISAKEGLGVDELKDLLWQELGESRKGSDQTLITNVRHFQALTRAKEQVENLVQGLTSQRPTDLVAEDIKGVLFHLGEITGEVTNDEVLGAIFSRFCIGK